MKFTKYLFSSFFLTLLVQSSQNKREDSFLNRNVGMCRVIFVWLLQKKQLIFGPEFLS